MSFLGVLARVTSCRFRQRVPVDPPPSHIPDIAPRATSQAVKTPTFDVERGVRVIVPGTYAGGPTGRVFLDLGDGTELLNQLKVGRGNVG